MTTTTNDYMVPIATMAANFQKKTTKAQAFDELKEIIGEYMVTGRVTSERFAPLYQFFMPSIPAKAKTEFDYLRRFLPKNDPRHFLQNIYSDGKTVYATNGHIAAWTTGINLDEGFYDQSGSRLNVDNCEFPVKHFDEMIGRIRDRENETVEIDMNSLTVEPIGKIHHTLILKREKFIPDGRATMHDPSVWVQLDYLRAIANSSEKLTAMVGTCTEPLFFENVFNGVNALLMPLRHN